MALPSASRVGLAELCAFPWTGGVEWPEDPPSKFSARGNAIHKIAEHKINGATYTLDDIVREFKIDGEEAWLRPAEQNVASVLSKFEFEWIEAETVVFYEPLSGTVRRGENRFGKRAGELTVIVDVIREHRGALAIADWKSGKITAEPAVETPQTRLCGLVAAKLYGHDSVRVELAYVGGGGGAYVNGGELDALELEWIETGMRKLVRELPTRTVPVGGPHCGDSWCPLRTVCDENPKNKKRKGRAA